METILDQVILGNKVSNYVYVGVVIVLVTLLRRFLSSKLSIFVFRLIKDWSPKMKQEEFVQLLVKPIGYFLILTVFIIASSHLVFPTELNFTLFRRSSGQNTTLLDLLNLLLKIGYTVTIIMILMKIISFVALIIERRDHYSNRTDKQFVLFFRDFLKAIVFIIGAIAIINILFGREVVEKLIAGLGIGAAALALAAKESIENLIASFIIFFDKPFRLGDTVKIDGWTGSVERIGLRSTRLRTAEKTFVTVPNKKMVDSILDNQTQRSQQRVSLKLELSANARYANIQELIQYVKDILEKDPDVKSGYTVNLNDFSKDSYQIQIIYMTDTIESGAYNQLRERINLLIMQKMEDLELRILGYVKPN
jgi:MscS family membrane protein